MLVNIHFSNYHIWKPIAPVYDAVVHFASLKIELISDTNAQLIQNSITSYHKNQERTRKKNKKRERKNGKIIGHMTERKRRQNRVAAFLCKAEWINETAPK